MKKLTALLSKLHFFPTCIHLIWSLLIVAFSIFGGYQNLTIDIPPLPVAIAVILTGMTGIFLQHQLFTSPKKKCVILRYQIFYYAIPAVFSFGKVIFCNSLYHFGGFMPGLEELGFVITFLFTGSIAVLGCVIFWIVYQIRKKREQKGASEHAAVWKKAGDLCNILSFFAITITLTILAASYGTDTILKLQHEHQIADDQAYLAEALAGLQRMQGREIDQEDLFSEAFSYAKMTEYLACEEAHPLTEHDLSSGSFSHIEKEVLEMGRANYLEFAKRYQILRGVEMLNQEILGNADAQTVSVSSELYVMDTRHQTTVHGCMIVTFDSDWNVIQIQCSDLSLSALARP